MDPPRLTHDMHPWCKQNQTAEVETVFFFISDWITCRCGFTLRRSAPSKFHNSRLIRFLDLFVSNFSESKMLKESLENFLHVALTPKHALKGQMLLLQQHVVLENLVYQGLASTRPCLSPKYGRAHHTTVMPFQHCFLFISSWHGRKHRPVPWWKFTDVVRNLGHHFLPRFIQATS